MSRDENQLFVGRLPRGTRSSELEDVFYKYGKMTRCDVKQGLFTPTKSRHFFPRQLCV